MKKLNYYKPKQIGSMNDYACKIHYLCNSVHRLIFDCYECIVENIYPNHTTVVLKTQF